MNIPHLSRRRFMLTTAAVSAVCLTEPSLITPAALANPVTPVPTSLTGLEAYLASSTPAIYLLETTVPENFATSGGSTMSISDAHGKVGTHSMLWDHQARATLRIDTPILFDPESYETSSRVPSFDVGHFAFWVYNETPVADFLTVEFGKGSRRDCWFTFNLDFTGWRTAWVRYGYDTEGTPRADMDRITITSPETSGQLWFDQIVVNALVRGTRATGDLQVPFVASGNVYDDYVGHWNRSLVLGSGVATPSVAELRDADTIHAKILERSRSPKPFTADALNSLASDIDKLGIPGLADPAAVGTQLRPANPGAFVSWGQNQIWPASVRNELASAIGMVDLRVTMDMSLRAAQTWDSASKAGDTQAAATAAELYLRIVAHLHDQGWAMGSSQGTLGTIGYQFRGWVASLLVAEPLLRERGFAEQAQWALVWFSGAGRLTHDFTDEDHYLGLADALNTLSQALLVSCLLQENASEQVRWLRTFSTWFNGAFSYSPGLLGGFKSDGTIFHHHGPYASYGRDAMSGSTPVVGDINRTVFGLKPEQHGILRKALLTQRFIANTHQYPIAFAGRHPNGTEGLNGIINTFAVAARIPFNDGAEIDTEMAAGYRRILPADANSWQRRQDEEFSTMGVSVEPAPEGYRQYGYAAAGQNRQNEWSVTVRGHNRYLWTGETYDGANMYGRYLTYGQIEAQVSQDDNGEITHAANGFVQPGWDWNHIPGTTTIILPFEKLRADLTGRSELLPLTRSRMGGAGIMAGHATLFGMTLLEHPFFDSSHRAKISVLFVGDRIIALGSAISNDDMTHPTHTTLFQASPDAMVEPHPVTGKDNWLVDPNGHGYIVLSGSVNHRTASQTAPNQNDRDVGTATYSLGWLNHGTGPRDAGYAYLMLLQGGTERTQELGAQLADAGPGPVTVVQRDGIAHVVSDRASNVTAHTIFEGGQELQRESVVRSTNRPGLVLLREGQGDIVHFSVTDPDLHLYDGEDAEQFDSDGNYTGEYTSSSRSWASNPSPQTKMVVTLRGWWQLVDGEGSGVLSVVITGKDTAITVTTSDAKSVEFSLMHAIGTSVDPSPTPTGSVPGATTPPATYPPTSIHPMPPRPGLPNTGR